MQRGTRKRKTKKKVHIGFAFTYYIMSSCVYLMLICLHVDQFLNSMQKITGSGSEEIIIRHEEDGDIIATSTQTIKDPDGTVRKVHKVERLREDSKGGSARHLWHYAK